ncbi:MULTISPECIES: hypothetical protein [unclassified Oceanispirochaeta]|uniref:hypothetical protein n=1 Tax=unclassified Oceanispirochaeta TaxID=2635722 RepID=UPI000E094F3A|nr:MULTISPECIES: hypothetical protein [unclassified Oceanispirochaeta]MBF9016701.1 hypothetical protein [Oceanispirochaeta sp. M2]NPD73094.1 hypothetical protein [Oceanispirochaeta sp. M1]RDG31197.1 hypothetical protein DV872_13400 [Oceanispirochaeta sp. M1]
MISEISLMMSGALGQKVINFYMSYQLLFNTIVVLYGAILLLAHLNEKRIIRSILTNRGEDHLTLETLDYLEEMEDPEFWKTLLKSIKVPIISTRSALYYQKANRENILKNLTKHLKRRK